MEGDAIGHGTVPVGVRHEAHRCVRGEQSGIRSVDRTERGPAAAGRLVLPGAVGIVHGNYRDAGLRAAVSIADLPGDHCRDQGAGVANRVLVDRAQVVGTAQHRSIVVRIDRDTAAGTVAGEGGGAATDATSCSRVLYLDVVKIEKVIIHRSGTEQAYPGGCRGICRNVVAVGCRTRRRGTEAECLQIGPVGTIRTDRKLYVAAESTAGAPGIQCQRRRRGRREIHLALDTVSGQVSGTKSRLSELQRLRGAIGLDIAHPGSVALPYLLPGSYPVHRAVIAAEGVNPEFITHSFGRAVVDVRSTTIAATGLIPGVEGDAIGHGTVPVGVRHEAHRCVRGEQSGIRSVDRTERGPAAAGRLVLPGAVGIVHGNYRDAGLRAAVSIADLPGDHCRDQGAGVANRVFVDRAQVVGAGEHRGAVIRD